MPDGKFGCVDKTGKFVINPQFDMIGLFLDGIARVKVNDKWGYIDKKGNYVINPQFDMAFDFSFYNHQIAQVILDGKLCYIDRTGRIIWQAPELFEPEAETEAATEEIVVPDDSPATEVTEVWVE